LDNYFITFLKIFIQYDNSYYLASIALSISDIYYKLLGRQIFQMCLMRFEKPV